MLAVETRLVNLMSHDLVVVNGGRFILPPSGQVAHMDLHAVDEMLLHVPGAALPLASVRYGVMSGLPPQRPSVMLVVSRAVAAEIPRPDLVFPDLEICDEHHRVVGYRRLARFAVI